MDEQENGVKTPRIGFKQVCGFGVNDAPLWVYKAIAEPANERFNGTYWMRIAELLFKEQAYEDMVEMGLIQRELVSQSTIPPQSIKEQEKIDRPKYLGQK